MTWDNDDAYSVSGETPAGGHVGLWPEGNYEGTYLRHKCAPSAAKGTPGISIWFDVQGREVQCDCWITEATLAGFTGKQLEALGWNGSYANCEFEPPESVPLFMKHELYKNQMRERWNISAKVEARPGAVDAAERAAQVWKARLAKPAAAPPGKPSAPKTPPKAATPPAAASAAKGAPKAAPAAPSRPGAPTPPGKAPKKAAAVDPKEAERDRLIEATVDADSAWAVWVHAECDDGDAFWRRAAEIAGGEDTSQMTQEQWQEVARAAPPF